MDASAISSFLAPASGLMDSLFLLSSDARHHFLQTHSLRLDSAYICLWCYLPHPSNCLISLDGLCSSEGSLARRLFEVYRGSFYSLDSGCVPGLAFNRGLPCIQLEDSLLMGSCSTLAQQQFYKEAGIKIAVFMACKSGEIELGFSTTTGNASLQASIEQLFSEEQLMVQGLLPSADHQQNWLPTSSASPQSNIMINTPAVPETLPPYSLFQHKLPSPQRDDLELARAMLAVISCTSSSSSSSPSSSSSSRQIYYQNNITAFERYSGSNFSSASFEGNSGLKGQRMLKKGISFLRKIYSLKLEEASFHRHEARPSSSQLHHVISERNRREKLSESFQALRMLLPPGSKKDKASVLSKTKDYLKSLKAQINDLEERNRRLEMQAQLKDKQVIKFDESKDQRIDVQVIRESESTSKSQKINLRVIVRGAVKMIDLSLRILECLKGKGISNLVSVESNSISQQENIYIVTSLILQVQAGSWDEDSLKEAVNRSVQSLVTVEPDRR